MRTSRARPAAAGAVLAVAWLAFYAGWLALAPGGERGLVVFSDTAYLVPIVAATALATWAATRVPSGLRVFWILVALACASWTAGEALWSVNELAYGEVPFPWWTDACYLGFYVLALAALAVFFRPSLRPVSAQPLLDGCLALASLVLVWWWLVLRDVELGWDLASVVSVAYPVLDLVLLCAVASTPLVAARRGTLAGWLVVAAMTAAAISDGVYTRLALEGTYTSGSWIDLGWQVQACLLALAAFVGALGVGRGPDWDRRRSPLRLRVGVTMTAALVVVLGVVVLDGTRGSLDTETIVLVCAVAALLVVRGWSFLLDVARDEARRDPLTGVYDEPHLHDQLRRLAAAARQYGEPFALVLVRVPRRQEADALHRLVGTARELDLVARLSEGGFAVVLPRTGGDGAREAAERLRRSTGCAAAAGVAAWTEGDTSADVTARAQQLLAAAVALGGNHTRGPQADVLVHGHERLGQTALLQIVQLSCAVDARYGIADAHSRKVARLARDLAVVLELDDDAVIRCYLGGLLHAIGTLPLDEASLRPHGALSALHAKLELRHGARGAELVGKIRCAAGVAPIVGAYEEHWDGGGPRRMRGEAIPFEARVLAVANAITTLTEPHGEALPLTSALTDIWRLAGIRYDPEVVSALFHLVRDGKVLEAIEEEALVAVGELGLPDS